MCVCVIGSDRLVQMNLLFWVDFIGRISSCQRTVVCPSCQKFRKGVGGERGLARKNPEIEASFLHPFSYVPLGERDTFLENYFGCFWGVCFSPTPSHQPLFETSDGPGSLGGGPKPLHLKPGHLKMAFFSARCRLVGTFLSRRRLACLDGAFPVEFPQKEQ